MTRFLMLLLAFILTACGNMGSQDPFDNIDTDATAESIRVVSSRSRGLSLQLEFMGQVVLPNQQVLAWTPLTETPYIEAAQQWLSALEGIDGIAHHEIGMRIWVQPLEWGNGVAGPDNEIQINEFVFPTSGSLMIGSHTYEQGFDPIEFHANILHEMGHILGIGSFTEEYTQYDASVVGNGFKTDGSIAVAMYNKIYGSKAIHYTAVPFSDDGGHLYDYIYQEDKRRLLADGQDVPPLTQEFMANGVVFGSVTLAVLDDIGYVVNYSAVATYQP